MLVHKEVVLKVDDATITNCVEVIHKYLNKDMAVDISNQGSSEGEHGGPPIDNNGINIANDQDSLEEDFSDVMEDIAWFKSHVLVKDPVVVCTDNELLKVDDQMLKYSNDKKVIANTSEIHLTDPNGSVRVKPNSSSIVGTFHNKYAHLQLYGAGKEKVILRDNRMTELGRGRKALQNHVGVDDSAIQPFRHGRQLKHVSPREAVAESLIQFPALNNKVQTPQADKEILKTNVNKAEEEIKLLSEDNRTHDESNKGLIRSERKHSASNSTKTAREKVILRDNRMAEFGHGRKALQNPVATNASVIKQFRHGRHLKQVNPREAAAAESSIQLTALNNKVQDLQRDMEILRANLNKADKLTALNNKVQAPRKDTEILQTYLNKEDEVKLLYEENRTLHESNKGLLRSERKHSASNYTKIHDGNNDQTLSAHTVVDIPECSTGGKHGGFPPNNTNMNNNITGDQEFSEGEEPTELNRKDKGVFSFMKPVSSASLTVLSPLSFASFALVGSAGYPTTSKLKKDCILLGTAFFFIFALITCGVVHSLEERAQDINLATTMVIAEIAYAFLFLCMDAMFFAEAPWFIVPLGLFVWIVLASWFVRRFHRPSGLYNLKRFRFKSHIK